MSRTLLCLCFLSLGLVAKAQHQPHGSFELHAPHGHAACAAFKAAVTAGSSGSTSPVSNDAHVARMEQYDVTFYHLDINLERGSRAVSGNALIRATVTATQLDTFAFELYQTLTIDSVKLNGTLATVSRAGGMVNAVSATPIATGQMVDAIIYYGGTAPNSGATPFGGGGLGFDDSPTWGNMITWSLSQPYSAYEWWPTKQILTDKADSVAVWVTTTNTNKVGSNGLLQGIDSLPNNKVRYRWLSRYPINYYLISVAVGQYVDYSIYAHPAGADSILIQNYVYNNPQTLPYWQDDIDATAGLIEHFSELFGLYPFAAEKYGHSMAPLGGGMEHQTMTTQGTFGFTLTAHELAHQWFGDHVTCETWNDLFLNEGFASYCEYIAMEEFDAANAPGYMQDYHTEVMGDPDGSVFVADPADVNRLFDSRLTYIKGASILHTLRHEIGSDSLFYAILRTYLNTHGNGNASVDNLISIIDAATGESYQWFFDQWYYGEGHAQYSARWNQVGPHFVVELNQIGTTPGITPFFQAKVDVRVLRTGAPDTTIQYNHLLPGQQWTLAVGGTVTGIQLDYRNWIINTVTSITEDPTLMPDVTAVADAAPGFGITLYPNPAADYFILAFDAPPATPCQFQMVNTVGQVVRTGTATETRTRINTQGLAPGLYYIRIQTAQGTALQRIVVQ